MAGIVQRILPRTDYKFTAASLPATQTATIVVKRQFDVSRWREIVILLRVHAVTFTGSGSAGLIFLNGAADGYTDEDPGLVWTPGAGASGTFVNLYTVTLGTDVVPNVANVNWAPPFGPLLLLQLNIKQFGTAGTLNCSVSIDLNMKGD